MNIRKKRPHHGWSQEQRAKVADVSIRTIQRIERGAKTLPETLKCVATVVETDFNNLQASIAMAQFPMTHDEARQEALDYVRDTKSFYTHAFLFVVSLSG